MEINSLIFWFFFTAVLIAYYGLFRKSTKLQNITLLLGSYFFYGMVDWKMCILLFAATTIFYFLGIIISESIGKNAKKASSLTTVGVILGVGTLLYFKYLNFFIDEFGSLLSSIGIHNNINSFGIVMPLGISFFTFKLIAYVVEIHRETIKPSEDPIAFGTYIAFFPTIMSGPIDPPGKFIPQLESARNCTNANFSEGSLRILWGMFLKMCIADQLSGYTGAVFDNCEYHNATSIILASVLYFFQIYTDFAGYSEMSIGVSRMLGITVVENFNRPLFAQNTAEYWRRWHMSLTSWITQYIYLPLNLAFRNIGITGTCLAAVINIVVIGAWHGADWTFIIFGLYHGIIISIVILSEKKRKKLEKKYNLKRKCWWRYGRMILTFFLVDFALVLFQSPSIKDFCSILASLSNNFGKPFFDRTLVFAFIPIIILLFKEWKDEQGLNIHFLHSNNVMVKFLSSLFIIIYILMFGELNGGSFIYFQF